MSEEPFLPNLDLAPKIVRSRRRTLALHVLPDASVEVRVPSHASNELVRDFIRRNLNWILRTRERNRSRFQPPVVRTFEDGSEFLMLGETCRLAIAEREGPGQAGGRKLSPEDRLKLEGGIFYLDASDKPRARKIFEAWYRKQAEELIRQRIAYYNGAAGLRFNRVRINGPRRRWGSCSAKGSLNFNWRLVMAPLCALDSVVAHELAHLAEPNHSRRFWNRVAQIMPDYKTGQDWLKKNGGLLNF